MATELVGLEYLKKNQIKNKTCDGSHPFAFISYSHDPHDAQIVMNVFNVLYNKGYNLWIDTANMPHDENAWTTSAIGALRNKNCAFAFFFRSESSMSKETIAKELETIKRLRHVGSIVTVDIWHDEGVTAGQYYEELLNGDDDDKFNACERICNIVSVNNSVIRLAEDARNHILKLTDLMEEELKENGVLPSIIVDPPQPPIIVDPPFDDQNKTKTISLPDFVKKYNFRTFLKDTYKEFRLVGEGECAKYTTEYFNSTSPLTWSFVKQVLAEQGEAYILRVVEKEKGAKRANPSFITKQEHQEYIAQKKSVKYKKLDVSGLEHWSMCVHFGQYAWINDVLCRRIEDLGLPLSSFSLEYIPNPEQPEVSQPAGGEEKTGSPTTGGITGPISIGGKTGSQGKQKQTLPRNGYSFTLFGTQYEDMSQKNTMLTVFETILNRHPDKLDQLLEKLPCLREEIRISYDAQPSTFRAGKEIEINGRSIAIGTSLNRGQAFGYMKNLLKICGEPEDCLNVYQKPGEGEPHDQ